MSHTSTGWSNWPTLAHSASLLSHCGRNHPIDAFLQMRFTVGLGSIFPPASLTFLLILFKLSISKDSARVYWTNRVALTLPWSVTETSWAGRSNLKTTNKTLHYIKFLFITIHFLTIDYIPIHYHALNNKNSQKISLI